MTGEACQHPNEPHTVWYMPLDGGPPIPEQRRWDNRADALAFAERGIEKYAGTGKLAWVKIFRSDNESYTCFRWEDESSVPVPRQSSAACEGSRAEGAVERRDTPAFLHKPSPKGLRAWLRGWR